MPGLTLIKHHRRSIRLAGYDYAQPGAYFVTISTQARESFFGDIADCLMNMDDAGRMVVEWWEKIPDRFPSFVTDEYVVMPNHFHGIVVNVGADPRVCPGPKATLPRIVQWFKTMTTNEYMRGVRNRGWAPFDRRLWQRNYYERVIPNEVELNRAREYIVYNPRKWAEDSENPNNIAASSPSSDPRRRLAEGEGRHAGLPLRPNQGL